MANGCWLLRENGRQRREAAAPVAHPECDAYKNADRQRQKAERLGRRYSPGCKHDCSGDDEPDRMRSEYSRAVSSKWLHINGVYVRCALHRLLKSRQHLPLHNAQAHGVLRMKCRPLGAVRRSIRNLNGGCELGSAHEGTAPF